MTSVWRIIGLGCCVFALGMLTWVFVDPDPGFKIGLLGWILIVGGIIAGNFGIHFQSGSGKRTLGMRIATLGFALSVVGALVGIIFSPESVADIIFYSGFALLFVGAIVHAWFL